ncbi:MAG TPA: hypothetical protein VK422_10535, partial [Pyrinomonadaceae bacterium]|nr:hypothetical protein [Pyrinomonadaceae bacterium]
MGKGFWLKALALPLALAAGCAPASRSAGPPDRNADAGRPAADGNNAATPPRGFSEADYARHIEQLRKKLPSADFHVVVEK